MIGRMLAHYRIESALGRGGMGVVYKAVDTRLGRTVAIKLLPADTVVEPDRKRRFLQEARAASALNHPSIVQVYDLGEEGGIDFIVMECVEGETLEALIGRTGISVGRALRLAIGIADGLAAAHAGGIVHRDIKPSNIMVTGQDDIKILDFGLAKMRVTEIDAETASTMTRELHTKEGAIVGTVAYMSPEQAEGRAADARADIFSFGAVLYEMLAGRRAFAGMSTIATLAAILKEEPKPIREWVSGVPRELAHIVARCLRKDPAQRAQMMVDVKLALQDVELGDDAPPAVVPRISRRPWIPIAIVAAGLAIGAGWTIGPLMRGAASTEPRFLPLATEAGQENRPAWSPDGTSVAYLAEVGGARQVFARTLGTASPLQITKVFANCDDVFWHPDGTRLYYRSDGKLWLQGIAGGEPQLVIDRAGAGSVSPDGRTLVLVREREPGAALWLMSPDGANPRLFAQATFPERFRDGADVRFSPDGTSIGVVLSQESGAGGFEFWVIPYPSGVPRRVLASMTLSSPVTGFDWTRDGRHFVFSAELTGTPGLHLYAAAIETSEVRALTPGTGTEARPSVSPDGKRIAFVAGGRNVDLIEGALDGGPTHALLATSRDEQLPSWSSNGRQYAYAGNANGAFELWVRTPAEGWARPIVTAGQDGLPPWFQLRNPRFSPDNSRVLYELWGPEHSIWISPVGNGRSLRIGEASDFDAHGASWSPDGNQIAYTRTTKEGGGSWSLVRASVGGGTPAVVLNGVFSMATEWTRSRSGEWIAFSNPNGVQIVSPDGARRKTLLETDSPGFGFSRDGGTLYVLRPGPARWELAAIDVDTGATKKTLILDIAAANELLGFSLHPDGTRFATSVGTERTDIWIMEGFAK